MVGPSEGLVQCPSPEQQLSDLQPCHVLLTRLAQVSRPFRQLSSRMFLSGSANYHFPTAWEARVDRSVAPGGSRRACHAAERGRRSGDGGRRIAATNKQPACRIWGATKVVWPLRLTEAIARHLFVPMYTRRPTARRSVAYLGVTRVSDTWNNPILCSVTE